MKLTGRQSKNVEVAPSKLAQDAPHSNPFTGAMGRLRQSDEATANFQQRIDATRAREMGAKNPMARALKGMDNSAIKFRLQQKKAKKAGQDGGTPIPTPRPDPSKPYKKPTVLTNDYKH